MHLVIFVVVVVYDDGVKMIEGAMFHEGGTGKYWPMRWPASEKMMVMIKMMMMIVIIAIIMIMI